MISADPDSLTLRLIEKVFECVPEHNLEILRIGQLYGRKFKRCATPLPFFDRLRRSAKHFDHENFVKIFQRLCDRFESYRESRLQACGKTIHSLLITSSRSETITACYEFLIQFPESFTEFDFEEISRHLESPDTLSAVLVFLMKLESIDCSLETWALLVKKLLRASLKARRPALVLGKLSENRRCTRQLMSDLSFLAKGLPQFVSTFKLFQKLQSDKKKQPALLSSGFLGRLFVGFLEEKAELAVVPIGQSILDFEELTEQFLEELEENHFTRAFYEAAVGSEDESVMKMCLQAFLTLAQVGFVRSFKPLAKQVGRLSDPSLSYNSLCRKLVRVLTQ
jgi:hypothetical protein